MAMLNILPRLTSWSSEHKKGNLEKIRQLVDKEIIGNRSQSFDNIEPIKASQELKQNLDEFHIRSQIRRSPKKKKNRRKKISYWSDKEAQQISTSRYVCYVKWFNLFLLLLGIQ